MISEVTELCRLCGINKRTLHSKGRMRTICASCKMRPWTRHKASLCERCGFVPEHPCQLDVDHKDGSKLNDSPDNLETLCANCHRLKTLQHGDHLNFLKRPTHSRATKEERKK